MTPAARFFRNVIEKLLRRFYEGPEPPVRIAEEVTLFRVIYPMASPAQWADFAQRLAENGYREGYTRGFERSEREPEDVEPDLQLLSVMTHDWSPSEGHPLQRDVIEQARDPIDPLLGLDPEERADFFDGMGKLTGTHRVVSVDERGMPSRGE